MVPKVIHRPFLGRQGTWWMCWMLTGNQSPVEPAKVKAGIGPGWSAWLLPNYACKEETSWGLVSYETERPALDGLWICWSSHGILVIHAFTPTKAKYNFYPIILYVQILRRSLRFGKLRGLRWVRNSAYERKLLVDSHRDEDTCSWPLRPISLLDVHVLRLQLKKWKVQAERTYYYGEQTTLMSNYHLRTSTNFHPDLDPSKDKIRFLFLKFTWTRSTTRSGQTCKDAAVPCCIYTKQLETRKTNHR